MIKLLGGLRVLLLSLIAVGFGIGFNAIKKDHSSKEMNQVLSDSGASEAHGNGNKS